MGTTEFLDAQRVSRFDEVIDLKRELGMIKHLAESIGAQLRVESAPGQGARVIVEASREHIH